MLSNAFCSVNHPLAYLIPPDRVFGRNSRFSEQSYQFVLATPLCVLSSSSVVLVINCFDLKWSTSLCFWGWSASFQEGAQSFLLKILLLTISLIVFVFFCTFLFSLSWEPSFSPVVTFMSMILMMRPSSVCGCCQGLIITASLYA